MKREVEFFTKEESDDVFPPADSALGVAAVVKFYETAVSLAASKKREADSLDAKNKKARSSESQPALAPEKLDDNYLTEEDKASLDFYKFHGLEDPDADQDFQTER